MISCKELQIRQSILAEFEAGSKQYQAFLNISAKFGSSAISKGKINHWYRRFKYGDISLFNKKSKPHGIAQAIHKLSNENEVRTFKI
jgi:hypothetical protein